MTYRRFREASEGPWKSVHKATSSVGESLAFRMSRYVKINAAIVIQLDGRSHVEIGERDLLGAIVEHVHRLSHDGVVVDFLLMAIAKDQHRRIDGLRIWRADRVAFRSCQRRIVVIFSWISRDAALCRRQIDDNVQCLF